MKILVLNCGSSTLKFQVIETNQSGAADRRLAAGIVERIGAAASFRFEKAGASSEKKSASVDNHEAAVKLVIEWLRSLHDLGAVDAVGHRVVHGGERFAAPARIDADVIATLESLCEIAPLHNPPAVSGIRAAQSILGPALPMVAVFDTSFHRTIPDRAAIYAIPYELSEKHRVRRYGFHGLAHQYSLFRYGELIGKPLDRINVITLHLGNGCSATAIRAGRSVDTSMGFTPLEGLVMGTRSGDLDPALVSYLAHREGVGADEVEDWLNHRCGLLGLSGISNDMRELVSAYNAQPRARLAVDIFCYRARKYVGAYLAALGGAEAVIFSGGIGENSATVRANICAGMEWCGLKLDPTANRAVLGRDGKISSADSSLAAFVIHTDEEALIARETARVIEGGV